MTVAPMIWSAQVEENRYSDLKEFNNFNIESTAIAVVAFSFKTVPSPTFLWIVFLYNSCKYQLEISTKFLVNKADLLLSHLLKNVIYVFVSINAP